jgi:chromosome segregation ATPase
LKRGASKGEKEKLFEGKIAKITAEIKDAEETLKRLIRDRNEKELSLEQNRKEVKELRAKIAAEEVKIE